QTVFKPLRAYQIFWAHGRNRCEAHPDRAESRSVKEDTKLASLRLAMSNDDWDGALRVAARFQRLGKQAAAIRRAADAVVNPSFYLQLGYDLQDVKSQGIAALKERFNQSWEEVQRSKN